MVSGILPDGGRFSGSSPMYTDPAGVKSALLSDFILRLTPTKRVFATWELSPEAFSGDMSVLSGSATTAYALSGSVYQLAPLGGLLAPFVSVRDEAILNWVHTVGADVVSTELGRFTASGNRLLPRSSAFASVGGRFSLSFVAQTGVVTGFVSLENSGAGLVPKRFTGVILQGGYRGSGGLLGIGITDAGETLRFEPAN
jgi:hypothetical protein